MFRLNNSKQSLVGIVADAFRLLRHTWAVNIVVILIYYIIYLVLQYIFNRHSIDVLLHSGAFVGGQGMSMHVSTTGTSMMSGQSAAMGVGVSPVLILIGGFLSVWIGLIFRATLVRSCWNVATSGSARLGNAFKLGFKYFHVYFVTILIYIVSLIILAVIVWLFSLIGQTWLTAIAAIVAACVYYYLAVKFFVVQSVAVIEECGMSAIGRAWRLTNGSWWRTLGSSLFSVMFYAIFVLFTGVGVFLFVAVPGLLAQLGHGLSATAGASQLPQWFAVLYIIDFVVTILAFLFTVPSMTASNQAVLINDLKNRSTPSS